MLPAYIVKDVMSKKYARFNPEGFDDLGIDLVSEDEACCFYDFAILQSVLDHAAPFFQDGYEIIAFPA